MKQAPAQKQWAMNHCLAEIGIHIEQLRKRAIAIGERLAVLIDYPASPGCTPPYAPIWIAEMVRRREGRAGADGASRTPKILQRRADPAQVDLSEGVRPRSGTDGRGRQ